MQASRGAGATLVSKNVAWATLGSNVTPKIFVGLVNKISILGWFDQKFCNLLAFRPDFSCNIGFEIKLWTNKLQIVQSSKRLSEFVSLLRHLKLNLKQSLVQWMICLAFYLKKGTECN